MATADRERPRPALLAALGVVSLVGSALIGWSLRTLRAPVDVDDARPSQPTALSPALATPGERGRLVFQVQCARCHGNEGRGDGPDSATLKPPPRDFRAIPWRQAASREGVRKTVVEGVPNSMMPALGSALSSVELEAVVDHVLSLTVVPVSPELVREAGFTPTLDDRPAPPLSVRGAGGTTVALDQLRGKLVLIHFWGTSCLPCQEELPDLEALAERFRDSGLVVLPVCVDENDVDVARQVASLRAPRLPVLVDSTGAARLAYDVQALPMAALVAPDGRLLGQAQGVLHWSGTAINALMRVALGISSDRSFGVRPGK